MSFKNGSFKVCVSVIALITLWVGMIGAAIGRLLSDMTL